MPTYKSIDILVPQTPLRPVRRSAAPTVVQEVYRKRVPAFVHVIANIFLGANAVLLALQGLGLAVTIFNASVPVGLALFLTGIGLLVLSPALLSLYVMRLFSRYKVARSRMEFWGKTSVYLIGGIVAPWAVLVAVAVGVEVLLAAFGLPLA